jgi:iron-sulfur cluster assembly accessory protein
MSPITLTKMAVKELAKMSNGKNVLFKVIKNDVCKKFVGLRHDLTLTSDHPAVFDEIVKINKKSNLIIEERSLLYTIGTEIDYDPARPGTKFVFNNPSVATRCKCGDSFTVDFHKS